MTHWTETLTDRQVVTWQRIIDRGVASFVTTAENQALLDFFKAAGKHTGRGVYSITDHETCETVVGESGNLGERINGHVNQGRAVLRHIERGDPVTYGRKKIAKAKMLARGNWVYNPLFMSLSGFATEAESRAAERYFGLITIEQLGDKALFMSSHLGGGCSLGNGVVPEDEVYRRVKEVHGDNIVLVEYAGNVSKKSTFECNECGHIWETQATGIMSGRGCKPCGNAAMGKAQSTPESEVHERIFDQHGTAIIMLVYGGTTKEKSTFRCNSCCRAWKATAGHILHGQGCRPCNTAAAGVARAAPEGAVRERIFAKRGTAITMTVYGAGTNAKSQFSCNECGHAWSSTANDIMNGHGCKKCACAAAGKARSAPESEIHQRIAEKHGGAISMLVYGAGTNAKSQFSCNECGNNWVATADNVMRGQGCRPCGYIMVGKYRSIRRATGLNKDAILADIRAAMILIRAKCKPDIVAWAEKQFPISIKAAA